MYWHPVLVVYPLSFSFESVFLFLFFFKSPYKMRVTLLVRRETSWACTNK